MNPIVAQPAQASKQAHHEKPAYWAGFGRYAKGESITACFSITEARGWLYGEYAEKASAALECGGRRLVNELGLVNPDALSDEEVEGRIMQAEDSEERQAAEWRSRGR